MYLNSSEDALYRPPDHKSGIVCVTMTPVISLYDAKFCCDPHYILQMAKFLWENFNFYHELNFALWKWGFWATKAADKRLYGHLQIQLLYQFLSTWRCLILFLPLFGTYIFQMYLSMQVLERRSWSNPNHIQPTYLHWHSFKLYSTEI